MKTELYSVRDVKAKIHMRLHNFQSEEVAKRAFMQAVSKHGDPMADYPDDYVLYKVGEWDDSNGIITPCDPVRIIGGLEALSEQQRRTKQLDLLHAEIQKLEHAPSYGGTN